MTPDKDPREAGEFPNLSQRTVRVSVFTLEEAG